MRAFPKNNSLSIVFLLLFLAALCGQAIAGHAQFNDNADSEGDPRISLARYVVSWDALHSPWQRTAPIPPCGKCWGFPCARNGTRTIT